MPAYNVEKRSDDLLIGCGHALHFLCLAFVIFERDFLACDRVRLAATDFGDPLGARPHGTGNIVDVYSVSRMLAWSPAMRLIRKCPANRGM